MSVYSQKLTKNDPEKLKELSALEYLTVSQAAVLFGKQTANIYKWLREKQFPLDRYESGNSVTYILRTQMEDFLTPTKKEKK